MNPRTAKKIKGELEAGLQFCVTLHNLLRGVIFDIDHEQAPYLPTPLIMEEDNPIELTPSALTSTGYAPVKPEPAPATATDSSMPWAVKANAAGPMQAHRRQQQPQAPEKTTASPGQADGSTLRKLRKKKLPPNSEPPIDLPEFDGSGKRVSTKKEHNYRLFEVLRFRALRQGDFVAARTTSRDLWILARVLKDYPGSDMTPLEFLNLSEARRDAMFREKVLVKDVEDKDHGGSSQVARSLALPLPRTYSEAAEWGQR